MKDLVIYNGQINTMDPGSPCAEALAVKNGRIIALGTNEEIRRIMPFGAETVNAEGNSVFPGFFDTHVHFTYMGMNMYAADLSPAGNKEEMIGILTARERELKPGLWLHGAGYDETKYPGHELPEMAELDEIFRERPVFLERIDAHQILVNSAAFEALGLSRDEEGVCRDERGELTGIIKDPANGKAHKIFSDRLVNDEMRKEYMMKASEEILRQGTTSISALEGGELFSDRDVDVLLDIRDKLPINITMYHQTLDVERVIKEGQKQIGGCIVLDGSLGSHTAALFDDYSDLKGNNGNLYYSQKEIDDFVLEAHEKGLQVSMHNIGDRATERLLQAYEKAVAKYPRPDHRHRFEHFSMATDEQAKRVLAIGSCLAMQPSYVAGDEMIRNRVGEERMKRSLRFRTFMDMGLKVGGGSDAPVTPVSPFHGIACCMEHFLTYERMSFMDAVKMFTTDAAYLTFEEGERGSLSIGKYGDIAIADKNVLEGDLKDPGYVRSIGFKCTIREGEIKYLKK